MVEWMGLERKGWGDWLLRRGVEEVIWLLVTLQRYEFNVCWELDLRC